MSRGDWLRQCQLRRPVKRLPHPRIDNSNSNSRIEVPKFRKAAKAPQNGERIGAFVGFFQLAVAGASAIKLVVSHRGGPAHYRLGIILCGRARRGKFNSSIRNEYCGGFDPETFRYVVSLLYNLSP